MLPLNISIGNYRLAEFLGKGGMGEVYRAVHTQIDRVVAIKILSQTRNQEPRMVQRFLNEARIHANLKHPNIVTLYDFFEFENHPCIVMEFVDGLTLSDQLYNQTPLPLSEAVFIFQRIVEAIDYIHDHGVVHRDIKSSNIKISTQNEVKLLDFGIAKDANSPRLTREGNFIGTVQYLSPEQLMDNAVGDQSSDIWALGVLLYEMVTGQLPFDADSLTECFHKINTATYSPPESLNPVLPQDVSTIIDSCLKRRPASRYPSTRDLLHATNRLVTIISTPRLSTLKHHQASGWHLNGGVRIVTDNWPLWVSGSALAVLIIWVLLQSLQPPDRFQPQADRQILPGLPQHQELKVSPSTTNALNRAKVPVYIDSSPSGAKVYQKNRYVADTPWEFNAEVGSRIDAVLKYKGFKDLRIQIHVSEHSNQFVEPFVPTQ